MIVYMMRRIVSWPPNKTYFKVYPPRSYDVCKRSDDETRIFGVELSVPNDYGLDSVRTHTGAFLLRITATAENAHPVSIEIEASIKHDRSGFDARKR